MSEFSCKITDSQPLAKLFAELPDRVQGKILRPLVRDAGQLLAEAERREAPRESGLLGSSLGTSPVRSYARGNTLFVAVGVRRGFRRAVTLSARGKLRARSKAFTAKADRPENFGLADFRNPTKYLHLVHGGRNAVTAKDRKVLYSAATDRFFGRSVAAAKPNPFVDRAFAASAARAADLVCQKSVELILAEAGSKG
jgi:hypothetical protein